MLQIFVYDSAGAKFELDLYEEQPLKLTLSAEEISDIPVINSSFSKEFRIPATQTNSKVFKWWYEVNTVDFDITQRISAEIYVDGEFYKSGHIRIQGAFINEQTSNIDLSVVFFGETRDFASQVGEINLNQLSLTALDHDLSLASIQASWVGGLKDGDLRYILADRGYTYTENPSGTYDANENVIGLNNAGPSWTNGFYKPSRPLSIKQFTLMVRVKAIIDAIFAQTQYTYSADSYFNDAQFLDLYTEAISTPTAEYEAAEALAKVLVSAQQLVGGGEDRVQYNIIQNNPAGAWSNATYQYSVGAAGSYAVQAQAIVGDYIAPGDPAGEYTLKIYKESAGIVSLEYSQLELLPVQGIVNINVSGSVVALPGDFIYVSLQSAGGANNPYISNGAFEVTNTPLRILVADLMKYDVKCIDFLKGILTKFKMIMAPSSDNEFEFVIKPWIDYIGSGETFDWTTKLDVNKDVVLKPVFFDQSQLIEFTDKSDGDHFNLPFQLKYNRVYGALQFDSQNDLLKDTRKVETVFAPTPVAVVEGAIETSEFVIPYFSKLGTDVADHGHIVHEPIIPKPRLLWWNGLAAQGIDEDWYYTDGVTDVHNTTDYPRMTPYSIFPTTVDTINLNWFRETPEFVGPNLGESVYERYWNAYIQQLYSPLARIMTAYFNIDAQDLYNLSFDDVIFIKNSYWRVLKIYDAPLTETATVKVDLVKLLDYQTIPNINPPTPQGGGIDDVVVIGVGGGTESPGFKYLFALCDDPMAITIGTSSIPLSIGQSVNLISEIVSPTACWVVVEPSTGVTTAIVGNIYLNCIDCAGA